MIKFGSTMFCIILLMITMFTIVNLMFRDFHKEIQDLDKDLQWNIATFLLISEIIVDTAIAGFGIWIYHTYMNQ